MTNQALNQTYNTMYAQMTAWQDADVSICADWYARFCDVAARDYDENRALYA